jgi:predicted HAD superfamily Cof-like phosphohydrolase
MQTNYEKVVDFNRSFGVPIADTVQNDIFTRDPKLVDLRLSLITEEVGELKEAIENHDMTETIDALADILYVVYGAGASFGIDLDKAMGLVHESNMSKVCRNREVAEKTVEWYKQQFAENKQPYDSPAMRPDQVDKEKYVVYNESTGKVLKSIEYNPVSFKSMM